MRAIDDLTESRTLNQQEQIQLARFNKLRLLPQIPTSHWRKQTLENVTNLFLELAGALLCVVF
jgi:hypothetical protein